MNITIPPEALEAGARAIYEVMYPPQSHPAWEYARETLKEIFRGYTRAAFLAMVKAWPEAKRVKGYFTHDTDYYEPAFILPLPQEPSDAP